MTTSRTGPARRNRPGFTLLEVVVVVVLLAVVMAIVAPRFSGAFGAAGVSAGARGVAAMFKYARGRAVMDRLRYRVELDRDTGEYHLAVEEDPVRHPGVFKPASGSLGSKRRLPAGAVFGKFSNEADRLDAGGGRGEPQGEWVTFYPDGRADPAWVAITDRAGGRALTIQVLPALGRVKLHEGIPEELQ